MKVTDFRSQDVIEFETFKPVEVAPEDSTDPYISMECNQNWSRAILAEQYYVAKCIDNVDGKAVLCLDGSRGLKLATADREIPKGTYIVFKYSYSYGNSDPIGTITREAMDEILKLPEKKRALLEEDQRFYNYCDHMSLREPTITKESISEAWATLELEARANIKKSEVREKEREEEIQKERDDWQENGKWGPVDGKVVTLNGHTIEIDKLWKDIYEYRPTYLRNVGDALAKLRETKYEGSIIIKNPTQTIEINIESRNSKIDGVKMRKERIYPLLSRLLEGTIDHKALATYNKLSNIKMDVAMRSSIQISHPSLSQIPIPISIEFVNSKTLSMSAFGQKKVMPYSELAEILVVGRRVKHQIGRESYYKLAAKFDMDKAAALETLKNYHLMHQV